MQYKITTKPIFLIEIDDFFNKKINKEILNEVISQKKKFNEATIGKGLDKSIRNNLVVYYDTIFTNNRKKSVLLNALDEKFKDKELREILSSSPYPLCDFTLTNSHETQVSRYGGNKQKYEWHVDRLNNMERHITLVYWFCEDESKIKGGEFGVTNSPIYNGKTIIKNPEILKINYKNNKAIIFSSMIPHTVYETSSPKSFNKGRFSTNCWIGFK